MSRYSRWNDDEEKALRQGVAKYGEGKWKRILADTALMKYLDGRTNVDLKVRLSSPLHGKALFTHPRGESCMHRANRRPTWY